MVGVITLVATCLITQVACGSGVCSHKRSGHSATGNIMNKTQRRRKVAYPCALCQKAAGVDTILTKCNAFFIFLSVYSVLIYLRFICNCCVLSVCIRPTITMEILVLARPISGHFAAVRFYR